MAIRYHMMAVVTVTMIRTLVTTPWGVHDELAARTSTDVESARSDTQGASVAQVAESRSGATAVRAIRAASDRRAASGERGGDVPHRRTGGGSALRRVIYLYLNRLPDQALDAPHLAMLRFIYSDQGQHTVAKRGYTPLSASIDLQALRELSR